MSKATGQKFKPSNLVNQLLDTTGDGSGTTDMTRSTTTIYKCVPAATEQYRLARLHAYIEEGVNEKFDAALYGATQAVDSTGIVVSVENASGTFETLTPLPITQIGHWDLVAGVDMKFTDFPSGAADYCGVRWTFAKHIPGGLIIDGSRGEFLQFKVQGDLSDLVDHRVQVQGVKTAVT